MSETPRCTRCGTTRGYLSLDKPIVCASCDPHGCDCNGVCPLCCNRCGGEGCATCAGGRRPR